MENGYQELISEADRAIVSDRRIAKDRRKEGKALLTTA